MCSRNASCSCALPSTTRKPFLRFLPEGAADEETRAILNDPTALLELIESIQDAMAGREVTLAEFRAEQCRIAAKDGVAAPPPCAHHREQAP